ncbi:hypothetical protein [Sodalis-like endosymbiont of Proechinophthirus fluctus]|uniref:hypothetical protein n=1 Tax=Sodalis-like endosymbiont of Proechinophthirus fluctus TaxID=1462730 RepID=UPI00164F8390|nr:hypothetical protein [Sodalis-like endosymbiont of Proechinophthirus fluctus]
MLVQCRLNHMFPRLNKETKWSPLALSASALPIKPEILFHDEATSTLDDKNEQLMYRLPIDTLPHITLVRVAHRNSAARCHTRC